MDASEWNKIKNMFYSQVNKNLCALNLSEENVRKL